MILVLLACSGATSDVVSRSERDGFANDVSVRVTAPTNGETVESPFTVQFESGADVASVRLRAGTATAVSSVAVEGGEGELVVELGGGSWQLELIGEGADGADLSHHSLTVRVAEAEASWVTISSPPDGGEVPNPVTFAVSGSDDVDRVELLADGYSIGEAQPGGILTYSFTGTGYARAITAQGWAGDEMVAEDDISITVEPGTEQAISDFNELVVAMLETYPTDGTNAYYWPEGDDWWGTTRDIWYRDALLAEGDPQGRCYCVGLTWEVVMRAFDQADRTTGGDGTLNGLSVDEMDEFRKDWFVRDLWGTGVVEAMENYGIGERVTSFEEVRPGDFLQFWRHSGSGHNNIFIGWLTDGDGEIEGVRYWSTQGSTDGIDYNEEYFGSTGSSIDPSYFFAARMWMPEDWIPWH